MFFLIFWWKSNSKACQAFTFKCNINNSNTKTSIYYWIICLYPINICLHLFFFTISFLFFVYFYFFFFDMFYTKPVKTSNIIIYYIESNPMSSNTSILIKIYYICNILYFFRQIVTRKNSIKSKFILVILLHSSISEKISRN